ncbi:phage portal protein, partial [Pleionea sediminis]|uniref:phage portal protein n=1 Tax=Pleionea sediminis TaxID=2569479 RepID=UPI00118484A0
MNWMDKLALTVSPSWALKRAQQRQMVQAFQAVEKTRLHKRPTEHRSANALVESGGRSLRGQARFFDNNYDIVTAIFDTLENTVIGKDGIRVEPMPRTLSGEVHESLAQ